MVDLIVGLVVGAALGAAVCALALSRRRPDGARLTESESARAAAEATVAGLREQLAQEQVGHAAALAQLSDRFKTLATDTLATVVTTFNEGQLAAMAQREAKLDERLVPLQRLLDQYHSKVEELEKNRDVGYTEVAGLAKQMLDAQVGAIDETRKLNTILGRASARGRWGEVQLERILEISDMTRHVDFEAQVTVDEGDRRGRPDVVVMMPHGARVAIDAKVPYDAFDRALAATDEVTRASEMSRYASDVRQRITELSRRNYTDQIAEPLALVVCFVPSDQLLSAAFSADGTLFQSALDSRVLVAGPTTLLGLLKAIQLGWSQFETASNVTAITALAEQLVDRTVTLFGLVNKLGDSLDKSVSHYGSLVGSLEGSLLVTVRKIQEHGVRTGASVTDLREVEERPRPLTPSRWPNSGDDFTALDARVIDAEPDAAI